MSERQPFRQFETIALQWRALAERRRAHFTELYDSGRWKHYYTKEEFVIRLREVVSTAETWAQIAPSPAEMLVDLARHARDDVQVSNALPAVSLPGLRKSA